MIHSVQHFNFNTEKSWHSHCDNNHDFELFFQSVVLGDDYVRGERNKGLHSHSFTVHPYLAIYSITEIHFVIVNDTNHLKRKTKESKFAIQIYDIRL